MRRSSKCLVVFVVASVVIASTIFFGPPSRQNYHRHNHNSVKHNAGSLNQPPSFSSSSIDDTGVQFKIPVSQTLQVSIIETGGSRDDVVAALVHSFGSQPAVQLALYLLQHRHSISDVIQDFDLSHELPDILLPTKFSPTQTSIYPNILVLATCEVDITNESTKDFIRTLSKIGKTYLLCIIGDTDRWEGNETLEEAVGPWLEKARVEFVTLSARTAKDFAEKVVNTWRVVQRKRIEPIIRYQVPVFPVNITDEHAPKAGEFPVAHDEHDLNFAIQGDYERNKRDYQDLFHRLSEFFRTDESASIKKNLTLRVLGHGKRRPQVPEDIKPHVRFHENLPYLDYYTILSKSFAILPTLSSRTYLNEKALSSVPASLIAGVPLVATQALIDAYGYLNLNIVWPQMGSQSDIDVVAKILKMTAEERRKKKQAVIDRRNEIIKENVRRVGDWIEDALRSMDGVK